MPDDCSQTPEPVRVLADVPEVAAPGLAYRAPRDDPPGATAGDVLKGAIAVALLVIMVAGLAGMVLMAVNRDAVGADQWGAGEWVLFGVGLFLVGLGAVAALRSLRYYLTGRHRRRVASPPTADSGPP